MQYLPDADSDAVLQKMIPIGLDDTHGYRYVCCDCSYVENWVETQSERDEIKRTFG